MEYEPNDAVEVMSNICVSGRRVDGNLDDLNDDGSEEVRKLVCNSVMP